MGFALGGFFDGIPLHQIRQWHDLLSLVPGVDTIRSQVLGDGHFHALMYVVAAAGLWGLWRTREQLREVSGGALPGSLLVGFGVWHVVDSVLSPWLLGIHRSTEFSVGEAREIVFESAMLTERPEDAHDVLGTLRIASDAQDMATLPASSEEFEAILRRRHAMIGLSSPNPRLLRHCRA